MLTRLIAQRVVEVERTRELEFAVVDLETTGLFARGHDRVIEVGVIVVDNEGEECGEYATLVNPGRDLGPTDIHGIRGRDVADAPTFAEILGDLSERLRGRVLVAHNARFDHDFLASEFGRCGYALPDAPWLCTMELGSQASGERRLSACCDAMGIEMGVRHSARDDARAAAFVLAICLRDRQTRQWLDSRLAGSPAPDATGWPSLAPCGRAALRVEGRPRPKESYIATLLGRLPPNDSAADGAADAYLEVLDRALEDRRLAPAEVDALFEMAEAWGIDRSGCVELHDRYMNSLVKAARRDGVVTQAERADLDDVAALLSFDAELLKELLDGPFVDGPSSGRRLASGLPDIAPDDTLGVQVDRALEGLSVCFTGQLTCTIKGTPISREEAEGLALEHGLTVKQGVSKKLDLLIVADPDSLSGKAQKARYYGTRIMVERAFWQAVGVDVD
jgi:DNA polymerase-3 subunit epsilon